MSSKRGFLWPSCFFFQKKTLFQNSSFYKRILFFFYLWVFRPPSKPENCSDVFLKLILTTIFKNIYKSCFRERWRPWPGSIWSFSNVLHFYVLLRWARWCGRQSIIICSCAQDICIFPQIHCHLCFNAKGLQIATFGRPFVSTLFLLNSGDGSPVWCHKNSTLFQLHFLEGIIILLWGSFFSSTSTFQPIYIVEDITNKLSWLLGPILAPALSLPFAFYQRHVTRFQKHLCTEGVFNVFFNVRKKTLLMMHRRRV